MSRRLEVANLAGVVALAILCAFQWRQSRAAHFELHALERARHELDARLRDREQALEACSADLDGFRQQIVEAKADRATQESDERKRRDAQWRDAVVQRDEQLQALQGQLRETAADRNGMVQKYNRVVETLNERTRQLEELAKACRAARAATLTPAAPRSSRGPRASRGARRSRRPPPA